MNSRLAGWLTRAHGARWRRRFGAEFCALLEELPANPATLADAGLSALRSRGNGARAIAAGAALAGALLAFAAIPRVPHPTAAAHLAAPAAAVAGPRTGFPCDHPPLAWLARSNVRRCATA